MKILMIGNLYPPAVLGGYEILCEQITKEFISMGHEVFVQTSDFNTEDTRLKVNERGAYGETIRRNLLQYLPFGLKPRRARLRHLTTDLYNEEATLRYIRHVNPDAILLWSLRRLSLGPLRAAIRSGVPCAMSLNDDYLLAYKPGTCSFSPRRAASWLLDRSLFRRTTFAGIKFPIVTAISRSLLEKLKTEGVPLKTAKVIYQGVDVSDFSPKTKPGLQHKPLRLLYAGQLHEYKGVHTVIEALELLVRKGRDVVLEIVGTGSSKYIKRLESIASVSELAGRVSFKGRLPRRELSDIYRESDILVFSSIWDEPFGLTNLEAMASGTALVSTTCGGPGEFLKDGENAMTFVAGDAASLATAIEKLMDDPALCRRIAREGLRTVTEDFSMQRYAHDLEEFLINVAGGLK